MSTEADLQYLERIGEDAAAILGAAAVVLEVECTERSGSVRLSVRYDVGGTVHETAASGETVVAAHSALRTTSASDRLSFAFESLVNGP